MRAMSKLGRVLAAMGVAGVLTSCGTSCGWGGGEDSSPPPASSQAPPHPNMNVLLIVADDQPLGTVERMPALSSAPGFVSFDSYFDNNPLCCPTRATLLTGLNSHHTGVEVNLDAPEFDDSSTLATWLDDAGYETGLFGKYMNLFPWELGEDYVPPGWDEWLAFTPDAAYYDYTLLDGEGAESFGSKPADYSTDVLAERVDEFIRDAAEGSGEEPFFAYFAPYAPHAPRTPAPRHADAFADEPVELPENFNRGGRGRAPLVGDPSPGRCGGERSRDPGPVALAARAGRRGRPLPRDPGGDGRGGEHGRHLPLRQRLLARLAPEPVQGLRL